MPVEQVVVQTAHAVLELARRGLSPSHLDHPHLVVIGVDGEAGLHKAMHSVTKHGVVCVAFHESDRNDEMTAFATEPIFEDRRPLFRRFHCLKLPTV